MAPDALSIRKTIPDGSVPRWIVPSEARWSAVTFSSFVVKIVSAAPDGCTRITDPGIPVATRMLPPGSGTIAQM